MKGYDIVRVDMTPALRGFHGEETWKGVLDMFRFAGLLEGNVKDFPNFIEYEARGGNGTQDVQRWASFGFKAISRREFR